MGAVRDPTHCNKPLIRFELFVLVGGGECVDTEDCSNNGVCKPVGNGKGTCCCAVGFAGANCESQFTFFKISISKF